MENELKPCRVCGRKPKMKILYYPTGAECMIECKPIFRKVHNQVIRCCALTERAEKMAIEEWNRWCTDGT